MENIDLAKNEVVRMEKIEEYRRVIEEKLSMLRGAVTKAEFSGNLQKTIENLYVSIFKPAEVDQMAKELEIKNTDQFPDRMRYLQYRLPVANEAPSVEEFVQVIINSLKKKVDFKKCLHEGAVDQMKELMKIGPVFIWTAGDARDGFPEQGLRGSREQFYKIAPIINPIRTKAGAKERVKIFAKENKLERIEEMCGEFQKRSINQIVIIEDQLKNLDRIQHEIDQIGGFTSFPIWVRQGFHKDNFLPGMNEQECEERFNSIDSVSDLSKKISEFELNANKAGFVIDWDGVMSNDKKRQVAQASAVFDTLVEKKWLKL